MHRLFGAVAAIVVSAAAPAQADPVPGHVIVARTQGAALLIWDATAEIAAITAAKLSNDDANARIERDALRVLAASLGAVKNSKTVTVRVLYARTGDVSPVYGTPTFAGIERYANLTVDTRAAAADKDKWEEERDPKVAPPAWIAYKILGQLPPR